MFIVCKNYTTIVTMLLYTAILYYTDSKLDFCVQMDWKSGGENIQTTLAAQRDLTLDNYDLDE